MNDSASNSPQVFRSLEFWQALDRLISEHTVIIDRPKGSHHPRYPKVIYPLDYGYLEGTTAIDGGGVDVFRGGFDPMKLTGLALTVDLLKNDVEVKLLLGCTPSEQRVLVGFLNDGEMYAALIPRPTYNAAEENSG